MSEVIEYHSAAEGVEALGTMMPSQLGEDMGRALLHLRDALGNEVREYVAQRLEFTDGELAAALAAEQVDGVALAMYNIEARGQAVIIGDQTGIGKGRQAAAMVRYGMAAGFLPVFFTDRYNLFSDMYRDCKALGIGDARPLVVNRGVSVVDFDSIVEPDPCDGGGDDVWTASPQDDEGEVDDEKSAATMLSMYKRQYREVYRAPSKAEFDTMCVSGDIPDGTYDYVMVTYSQLKDSARDTTRLDFLKSLCGRHRVLFIFDEAHRASSVTAGKPTAITRSINELLDVSPATQCVFLSATFAKRPECLVTFKRRTVLRSLASGDTLQTAFGNGGVPMQEYVASMLAGAGQMVRREHCNDNLPPPSYTYLDGQLAEHTLLFNNVMGWFRRIVGLSDKVKRAASIIKESEIGVYKAYPARQQLFYINKVLLFALKARDVAASAVREVKAGRSVVIGMSDTLECVLRDVLGSAAEPAPKKRRGRPSGKQKAEEGARELQRADFHALLSRLLDKTVCDTKNGGMRIFDFDIDAISALDDDAAVVLAPLLREIESEYRALRAGIDGTVFNLPLSPIDILRQLIMRETFTDPDGCERNVRFEECTGRARCLEYGSPDGDDSYMKARVVSRRKRHSNHIYNDFQNNKIDVILINACGAIGASAHAVATAEVPEEKVRQRKMLIVQNDLDVNIDLQKRGRINRTGQIASLPPLYEYIITSIPSEKRLNMMLRAKLRSLSANTTANQDQDRAQADFIDISNRYGDQIATDYISANPELGATLGITGSKISASLLMARVAMLDVTAQQDVIDELFANYLTLEQDLRRVNQWNLEREYRDFEAVPLGSEIFTTAIADGVLGGASMLSSFMCRHRTFPYDSVGLQREIAAAREKWGRGSLRRNRQLVERVDRFYERQVNAANESKDNKIKRLKDFAYEMLKPHTDKADEIVEAIFEFIPGWERKIKRQLRRDAPKDRILRALSKLEDDTMRIEESNLRQLNQLSYQRGGLLQLLGRATIGTTFSDVSETLDMQDAYPRVMAVLKDVRFDKDEKREFLPGRVQFVFALSAGKKEIVLNIANTSRVNNYDKVFDILFSDVVKFDPAEWNAEIAKYNNRVLKRLIVTGNILGAFSHPSIAELNPRFITFSLAPDEETGEKRIEHGLLLPMTGGHLQNILDSITLPVADAVRYATSVSKVYRISGIGVEMTYTPMRKRGTDEVRYVFGVTGRDVKAFESDVRYAPLLPFFKRDSVSKGWDKASVVARHTALLPYGSAEFSEIISMLGRIDAVMVLPRTNITAGAMSRFTPVSDVEAEEALWPALDWRDGFVAPPVLNRETSEIAEPVAVNTDDLPGECVDEYSTFVQLVIDTLAMNDKAAASKGMIPGVAFKAEVRSLKRRWTKEMRAGVNTFYRRNIAYSAAENLQGCIDAKRVHYPMFPEFLIDTFQKEAATEHLSIVTLTLNEFKANWVGTAPEKEDAQAFYDSTVYDRRLDALRSALRSYIEGTASVIPAI